MAVEPSGRERRERERLRLSFELKFCSQASEDAKGGRLYSVSLISVRK